MSNNFRLPADNNHKALLYKINGLKGKTLFGQDAIKGPNGKRFPPDEEITESYIYHDLIRGFYKPKGSDYMLSYLTTGESNQKSSPIIGRNPEAGSFQQLIMHPPDNEKDNRRISDIQAARKCLKDSIPIGIFERISKGEIKCYGLGVITQEREDGNFIIEPIDLNIKSMAEENSRNYFSFKTNKISFDLLSSNGKNVFEFKDISWHKDKTRKGDIVFFVQHGDKPKWNIGLSAICEISEGPYDYGYAKNKYKVKLKPLLKLPKEISRQDLIGYFKCYNITFIGPMTRNEPNQANNLMTLKEARYLAGALIDIFPDKEIDIKKIFGNDFPVIPEKAQIKQEQIKANDQPKDLPSNKIIPFSRNLIIYGAPGTGKSYELNERIKSHFNHKWLYYRVTFHNNYTYKNFVGAYKPKPIYRTTSETIYHSNRIDKHEHNFEPVIEYVFEPGPMMLMLHKALKNPDYNFVIIIEEINRANAAAVFGDFFQLLDRDKSGRSEYPITMDKATCDFLESQGIQSDDIRLPPNLYIWATMNNADQGVMPLDTAFKRRWTFEYLSLNQNQNKRSGSLISLPFRDSDSQVKWNDFRKIINAELVKIGIHEDKLLGPFFLSEEELKSSDSIKNKLLLYLKEDVLKYNSGIFRKDLKTFSEISDAFGRQENIFHENINLGE